MKYLKYYPVLFLLSVTLLQAQETSSAKTRFGKFSLYVSGGAAYHIPIGEGIDNFEREVTSLEDESDSISSVIKNVQGFISPILGFRIGLNISNGIEIGSGIHYTQRGFNLEAEAISRDPEFSRDDKLTYSSEVSASALETLLWMKIKSKGSAYLNLGLVAGFPFPNSAEAKNNIQYDVFLNGTRDEQYSAPLEDEIITLEEETKSLYPGFFMELGTKVLGSLDLSLVGKYNGSFVEYFDGDVGSYSFGLNLKYRIF